MICFFNISEFIIISSGSRRGVVVAELIALRTKDDFLNIFALFDRAFCLSIPFFVDDIKTVFLTVFYTLSGFAAFDC